MSHFIMCRLLLGSTIRSNGFSINRCKRLDHSIHIFFILGLNYHVVYRLWRYYSCKCQLSHLHDICPIYLLCYFCLRRKLNLEYHSREKRQKKQNSNPTEYHQRLHARQERVPATQEQGQRLLILLLPHKEPTIEVAVKGNHHWADSVVEEGDILRILRFSV